MLPVYAHPRPLPKGYLFARCRVLGIGLGDLLGCADAGAFRVLLHTRYRQAARRTHPDTVGGSATAWRRVQQAYLLLQESGWRQWRRRMVPHVEDNLPLPWAKGWEAS